MRSQGCWSFFGAIYRLKSAKVGLDLMLRQAGSSPAALGRSVGHALHESGWVTAADRRDLEAIFDLVCRIEESGKGTQLGRMLSAHAGKAVVFTEFTPTLEHLSQVCEQHGIAYTLFSGDLSRA